MSERLSKVPHPHQRAGEKKKLTGLNINIASSLRVAAPWGFSIYLYVSHVGTDEISAS